jgi:hypothetical protein
MQSPNSFDNRLGLKPNHLPRRRALRLHRADDVRGGFGIRAGKPRLRVRTR